MSYQSFLKSTAASLKAPSPSPISRKPMAPSATSSIPPSIHNLATHNVTPGSTSTPYTPPSTTSAGETPNVTRTAPKRTPLTGSQIDAALRLCLELQTTATSLHQKRPFGAILLGPDNTTVLLSHFSISHVQHAETELARLSSLHFSQDYLAACTLVSTWEPCAMCTGTIYWTNIGRIMYAASEEKLKELTGGNNRENMTMSLPCREIIKHGQKDIEIVGPIDRWEQKVAEESGKWWKEHGQASESEVNANADVTANDKQEGRTASIATTWTGEESVLSTIDDEGEYRAALDIDWMR